MSTSSSSRKRPDVGVDASNIVDGPRKRHQKDIPSANHSDSKSPSPQSTAPPARKITLKIKKQTTTSAATPNANSKGVTEVSEMGLAIWTAVKQATDSSGRLVAFDFFKLPPKKVYPDYYKVIKQPLSLDEIKAKLDAHSYPTVKAVKADFDIMFGNAKQYNIPGSGIWADADTLHKLVTREYISLTGDDAAVSEGEDEQDVDMDVDQDSNAKNSKSRPPSLHRLLKTRLQKLVKKKDSTGRAYSDVFMELPSKKDYPSYYKIIKKPMTFGLIDKKIDKKEYGNAQSFVNDMELVFSNAFQFNEEHSIVHTDAKFLQESFRALLSDLPPPYTVTFPPDTNTKASAAPTKIKLKIGQAAAAAASSAPSPASAAPATEPATKPAPSPAAPSPAPAPAPAPRIAPAPIAPAPTPSTPTAAYQAQYPYYNMAAPHMQQYAAAASLPPQQTTQPPAPAPPQPAPIPAASTTALLMKATPAVKKPVGDIVKCIKGLTLRTVPAGRQMRFENGDDQLDLRFWSMRLGAGEVGVEVIDVEVFERDEEGGGGDDDDALVEVKVGGLVVSPIDLPQPAAVLTNGNGLHDGSESDLSDLEGEAAPASASATTTTTTRKPSRTVSAKGKKKTAATKRDVVLKSRMERKRWDASTMLVVGSNTLDLKAGGGPGGASETWRVFVERVL